MPANYLPEVKSQYESLPYPSRDPQEDAQRLVLTWLEDLPMINHYCFAGKQDFQHGFRALVAGAGTGDATIFLAEQLRGTDAEVVHLDLSSASTAIARERARIRGLTNITFLQDSLLNIPQLGLGEFDYINCSGVLHHLADPDAGLRALRHALKRDGALGLMVYARTGRTGVYQMQSLLRMVNTDAGDDEARRIANTRDILATLPRSNWFVRGEELHQDHRQGDAGLYDLLLHSQDRAYDVDELFEWFEDRHGMHLAFTDVQRGRAPYLPHMVLGAKPPAVLGQLRKAPRRRQYAMAELLAGNLITHSFYATAGEGSVAPYGDLDYVPFFYHEPLDSETVFKVFSSNRGQPFLLQHQHSGVALMVNPGRYGAQILRLVDGKRSFAEIFALFRSQWHGQAAPPDDAALFADFAESYETLNALDRLLLRHRAVNIP
ncbi:MAG: class I SAM-dependent methyltransferase [Comamonadaceae bacterium]|nr:MAG: class I SAM-dependent methyltransferase [Comamonadaceae bacterium]